MQDLSRTLGIAALLVSSSCLGPGPEHDGRANREWLTVGTSGAVRHGVSADELEDGEAITFGGGLDLNEGRMRVALEVGGAHSWHEPSLNATPAPSGHLNVSLWRASIGLNLRFIEPRSSFEPFVRGGGFYRFEYEDDFHEDGGGYYFGGGLDFRVDEVASFGPFVTYYIGDDDLEEIFIGLSAVFRL